MDPISSTGSDDSSWEISTSEEIVHQDELADEDSPKPNKARNYSQDQAIFDFGNITGLKSPQSQNNNDSLALNFISKKWNDISSQTKNYGVNKYLDAIGVDSELRDQTGLNKESLEALMNDKEAGFKDFSKQALERIKEDPSRINSYLELSSKLLTAGKKASEKSSITNLMIPNLHQMAQEKLDQSDLDPEAKKLAQHFLDNPESINELKLSPQELDAVDTLLDAKESIMGDKADIVDAFALDMNLLSNDEAANEILGKTKGELFNKVDSNIRQKGWEAWRAKAGALGQLFNIGTGIRDGAIYRSQEATHNNLSNDLPGLALMGMGSSEELNSIRQGIGLDKSTLLEEAGGKLSHEEANSYLAGFADRDAQETLSEEEKTMLARAYYSLDMDKSKAEITANLERNKEYIDSYAQASDIKDYKPMEGLLKARQMLLNERSYDPNEINTGVDSAFTSLADGLASKTQALGLDLDKIESFTSKASPELAQHSGDIFKQAQAAKLENGYFAVGAEDFYDKQADLIAQAGDRFSFFHRVKDDGSIEKIAVNKKGTWSGTWDGNSWQNLSNNQETDFRDYIAFKTETNSTKFEEANELFTKDTNRFAKDFDADIDKTRLEELAKGAKEIYSPSSQDYQYQYYSRTSHRRAFNPRNRIGRHRRV